MPEENDSCKDYRTLSLQLYDKVVTIALKEGTEAFEIHGHEVIGKLIGRIWGTVKINDHRTETVVALHLMQNDREFVVDCVDIVSIGEA